MEIEIDWQILKITVPIFILGFGLIWWRVDFWTAFGVSLVCMAYGIRRTA